MSSSRYLCFSAYHHFGVIMIDGVAVWKTEQAYKIMKHLNKKGKDAPTLNFIGKEECIEHYKKLWFYSNIKEEEEEGMEMQNITVDQFTLEELKGAIKRLRNRKATGPGNINSELIKCGGILLHLLQSNTDSWIHISYSSLLYYTIRLYSKEIKYTF